MRVALVHDYLNQMGGAERVLEVVHELFDRPPVFTSVYDSERMPESYRRWDIRTSFLQRFPMARRRLRYYLPLIPTAFEQFDFSDYDVVISISSAWSKGVITPPETCHLSMILTPMRFAWRTRQSIQGSVSGLGRLGLAPVLTALRAWDVASSHRVDRFVAISTAVRDRIRKFYRRDAEVIYPPVDCSAFRPGDEFGTHYLVVSRLRDYKRIELVVEACTRTGRPLRVVGEGEDRLRLERMAGPTIEFLGRVSEKELLLQYRCCRAFVLPGEEDFGLNVVEAQACGRPVLAYRGGGALETVREGEPEEGGTGVLFAEPTVESLIEGMERIESLGYDPVEVREHALRFDRSEFERRFRLCVERARQQYLAKIPSASVDTTRMVE